MFSDSRLLLKLWLKNPMKIGAVAASSPELANAMARHIPRPSGGWGEGYVVELGGGTGPVTRAILAAGVPKDRLVVVERDPTLHKHLVERYPGVRVLLGDAMHLQQLLRREGVTPVRAIVSSLPLLSMKKAIQHRIGAQIFAVLEPDAPLIQFTYGLFSPLKNRRRLGVSGAVQDRVLQNLPPASVWLYRRSERAARAA
ncbi:MAG TPA: ribose ABC transporter permease [Dongiaceae bacterium]|nr:ribose ABC transporter permease [Dongiaceae bacterium]